MKKMILAVALLTTGIAVSAQKELTFKASDYNAYTVPEPILVKFQTTYTAPAIGTTWTAMDGYWRATYINANNRVVHVYYSMEPYYLVPVPDRVVGYTFALPVTNTFVPDNVIQAAVNRYGVNLYSITQLKTTDNADTYQVSLLENGTLRTVWLNADSMAFQE